MNLNKDSPTQSSSKMFQLISSIPSESQLSTQPFPDASSSFDRPAEICHSSPTVPPPCDIPPLVSKSSSPLPSVSTHRDLAALSNPDRKMSIHRALPSRPEPPSKPDMPSKRRSEPTLSPPPPAKPVKQLPVSSSTPTTQATRPSLSTTTTAMPSRPLPISSGSQASTQHQILRPTPSSLSSRPPPSSAANCRPLATSSRLSSVQTAASSRSPSASANLKFVHATNTSSTKTSSLYSNSRLSPSPAAPSPLPAAVVGDAEIASFKAALHSASSSLLNPTTDPENLMSLPNDAVNALEEKRQAFQSARDKIAQLEDTLDDLCDRLASVVLRTVEVKIRFAKVRDPAMEDSMTEMAVLCLDGKESANNVFSMATDALNIDPIESKLTQNGEKVNVS